MGVSASDDAKELKAKVKKKEPQVFLAIARPLAWHQREVGLKSPQMNVFEMKAKQDFYFNTYIKTLLLKFK